MNIYRINSYAGDTLSYVDSNTGLDLDFMEDLAEGNRMSFNGKVPVLKLKNKTKQLPDFLGTGTVELFVNDRVKKILEENVTDPEINFLPIKIDKYDYWLLNVIGLMECFDAENSEYTTFKSGNVNDVRDLKLIKENVPEISVFRIKEDVHKIFVTEKLKNILEMANITGVRYNDSTDLTVGF